MQLAAGICAKCGFENGEMDDTCRHCSAAITDLDLDDDGSAPQPPGSAGRKLKAHASHGDAPQRTMINATSPSSSHQEQSQIGKEDEEDMKAMMTKMMGMMGKITTDMAAVSTGVEEAKAKASEAVEVAKKTQADMTSIRTQIVPKNEVQEMIDESIKLMHAKIEEQLENIAKGKAVGGNATGDAMFGGLDNATRQEAEDWILRKLKELHVEAPAEIFRKGDSFKGMLYAKFSSSDVVAKIVKAFDTNKWKLNGKPVWAKCDLPISLRCPLSFLLGLRWQLLQWGYTKGEVKVDDTLQTMSVGGEAVVEARAANDKLDIKWLDEKWMRWEALQQAPELNDLIAAANTKLAKAAENRAKGKGKKGASSPP